VAAAGPAAPIPPRSRAPRLVAVSTDDRVLVTEDCSHDDWAPLIGAGSACFTALDEVASHLVNEGMAVAFQGAGRNSWAAPLDDPQFANAVGVAEQWLHRHGDVDWTASPTTARTDRIADVRAAIVLAALLLGIEPPS
jgi:hypothetical protein